MIRNIEVLARKKEEACIRFRQSRTSKSLHVRNYGCTLKMQFSRAKRGHKMDLAVKAQENHKRLFGCNKSKGWQKRDLSIKISITI